MSRRPSEHGTRSAACINRADPDAAALVASAQATRLTHAWCGPELVEPLQRSWHARRAPCGNAQQLGQLRRILAAGALQKRGHVLDAAVDLGFAGARQVHACQRTSCGVAGAFAHAARAGARVLATGDRRGPATVAVREPRGLAVQRLALAVMPAGAVLDAILHHHRAVVATRLPHARQQRPVASGSLQQQAVAAAFAVVCLMGQASLAHRRVGAMLALEHD
mmetsp:Transcript_53668/g.156003  ORF Transcript_53668/g.156003 Transcript_53668/m.156003 type:complete len:222 (+) Transcript_53668:76-741(+)